MPGVCKTDLHVRDASVPYKDERVSRSISTTFSPFAAAVRSLNKTNSQQQSRYRPLGESPAIAYRPQPPFSSPQGPSFLPRLRRSLASPSGRIKQRGWRRYPRSPPSAAWSASVAIAVGTCGSQPKKFTKPREGSRRSFPHPVMRSAERGYDVICFTNSATSEGNTSIAQHGTLRVTVPHASAPSHASKEALTADSLHEMNAGLCAGTS